MLKIEIETDNEVFHDAESGEWMPVNECIRLLASISNRLDRGDTDGKIMDANGNTVGRFTLTED